MLERLTFYQFSPGGIPFHGCPGSAEVLYIGSYFTGIMQQNNASPGFQLLHNPGCNKAVFIFCYRVQ